MTKQRTSSGFAALEGLLILIIVGIVALIGYVVYTDSNNANDLNKTSSSEQVAAPKTSVSPAVPAIISSSSDLDKAATVLNADNPDDNSADLSQVDSQAGSF